MASKKINKDEFILVRHSNHYIRKTADKNAEAIAKVEAGEKVVYCGKIQNGWYKVKVGKKYGWLAMRAGDVHEAAKTYISLKPGKWHIRKEPNAKSEDLGIVATEKVASSEEIEGKWLKIEHDGIVGWISEKAIAK